MANSLTIRTAEARDLPAIVRMLADDHLGSAREDLSDLTPYRRAFDEIDADPNNEILVAESDGTVVGTLQLTFTPSLAYRGGRRATVESVRTDASVRSRGIGTALMQAAVERARARGCVLIQLSSHASRTDAQRFYERLGFSKSHVGMKLDLTKHA